MKRQSIFATAAVIVAALALAWLLLVVLLRQSTPATRGTAASASTAPAATTTAGAATPAGGTSIKVHLLAVSADGLHLDAVQRDVPYAASTVDQASAIINAELALQDPAVSAIPKGTALKALYVTKKGDAYVDLSPEVAQGHPGGTTAELLTVYSIVDVLTMNLPAITSVQILVDGQEVDTLAGHVDLRRPLQKDTTYVRAAGGSATSQP